jgi:hypothetical protein
LSLPGNRDDVESPMRRQRRLALESLAGLILAIFFAVFIARGSFDFGGVRVFTLFDDAMISMRYAQNLALGHGLTWNAGAAPVEGFTNPLWTLWMTALHLLGIPPAAVGLWVSVSAALLVLATAFAVRRLARLLYPGDGTIAALTFWGTAAYYPLVFWSLRGMEVGLVTLLIVVGVTSAIALAQRFTPGRLVGLALVLSLAVLTRMELVAPAALIAAYAAWMSAHHRLPVAAVLVITLAITLGALTAWRLDYYGEWLPNTYYLKLGGVPLDTRLARGLTWVVLTCVMHLAGLLLVIGAGIGSRRAGVLPAEWLLAALFAMLCAYSAWVGGDAWDFYLFANRFLTPAVPLLLLIGLRAIAQLTAALRTRPLQWLGASFVIVAALDWLPIRSELTAPASVRGIAAFATAAVLLAAPLLLRSGRIGLLRAVVSALLLVGINLPPYAGWFLYDAPHAAGDRGWAAYGLLLKETTAPDATAAVTWAGNATYFSERRTFDQLGKTDALIAHGPHVSPVFRPGHSKWRLEHTIGTLRPDVIAALYYVTEADLARIEGWGYTRLVGNCYVATETTSVDIVQLRAGLVALNADPRFAGTVCVRQDPASAFPRSWLPEARTAALFSR